MDFINVHLAQNQVRAITIYESSKESDMYKYIAYVDLKDGN